MVFLHWNVGVFCQIRFILIYRYEGLIVTLVFRSSSLASLLEQAAGFGIFSKNQTISQSSWFGSWVLLVVSYFWPPWVSSRGFVCTIHVNVLVYCSCYCNIGGQFSKVIQYGDYKTNTTHSSGNCWFVLIVTFYRFFYYSKTILFSCTQLLWNQWNHHVYHL